MTKPRAKHKFSLMEWLWIGAPVAIWFSYQPLLRFGQDETMYFELSITIVYLLIMALAGLGNVWRWRYELIKVKYVWLVSGFVLFSALSLLWTSNLTRGVLTMGVLGLLYLVFLGVMSMGERFRNLVPFVVKVYIYSALVVCGLALVQFFAGVWLESSVTFLCAGCVAEQFGFVRPNVFLIEPQFLGNALLPAALLLTRKAIVGRDKRVWPALALTTVVLVLTLSRGALLAFAVGVIVLLLVYRLNWSKWRKLTGVFLVSLLTALCLQGLTAAINPTVHETFGNAVSKSINQLTMGIVDINLEPDKAESVPSGEPVAASETVQTPNFDGYVEESTNARASRSELALKRWSQDWQTAFFGVGIGSAGVAINQAFPDRLSAKEIVQNEYIELLLERGLVGLFGYLAILGCLFWATRNNRWFWAIIVAFMTQWMFFSGYPNALHIHLIFIAISFFLMKSPCVTNPTGGPVGQVLS